MNIKLINTTFETVKFNDPISSISVFWPLDIKVVDNRSGFIPNAHVKLTDTLGTNTFDGYTDNIGRIPQLLCLGYTKNQSSQIGFYPYTLSISALGYLDFSENITPDFYSAMTFELEAHTLPQAVISGDLMRYVDMDSVIFFDDRDSTGRSISYFWEFGNGETSASTTPSHTYTIPGVYQVNLTVTDDYDNTSTASIAVIVENVIPTAKGSADPTSIFEDEQIVFVAFGSEDTISDSISYLWDFGDSEQSDMYDPAHTYKSEGEYEVTLTVTDNYGGESSTFLYVLVSNKAPWDVSAGEDISVFIGHEVDFQGQASDTISDNGSLHYSWDLGDGMETEGQDVSHVYDQPGVYQVNLTVTDNDGASNNAVINVTVNDPEITTSISSTSIFQDEEVFFDASHEIDDGSFVYTWYFGDGSMNVWNETSHNYNRSGIFSPYLIIDTGIENVTIFLQEIVVNNVIPTPRIMPEGYHKTEDESITFHSFFSWDSISDRPYLTYVWDFGDGSNGPGNFVNHTYTQAGTYILKLTVSDGKSTNSTQVEIEVENLSPTADAGSPKERESTVGSPVLFDASHSSDTNSDLPELNYTWKIGEDRTYGKIIGYTFETSGEFTVVLEVRDNNGAVSEDTLTFEVSKSSEPDDEQTMNTISWILVVTIIVIMVVIGFLIQAMRDERLYKEMKAEEAASGGEIIVGVETIVVEGVIEDESFKPKDEVHPVTVAIAEEQGGGGSEIGAEGEAEAAVEAKEYDAEEVEAVAIAEVVTGGGGGVDPETVVEAVTETESKLPAPKGAGVFRRIVIRAIHLRPEGRSVLGRTM